MNKNELQVQGCEPEINIRKDGFIHCTSINKAVADRIRAASWDEIKTIDDPGFQVIARAIKQEEKNDY